MPCLYVFIFFCFLSCVISFSFILYCSESVLIYVFVENIDLYIVGFLKKKKRRKQNKTENQKRGTFGFTFWPSDGSVRCFVSWLAHGSAINTLPGTQLLQTYTHTHMHTGHTLGRICVCRFYFLSFILCDSFTFQSQSNEEALIIYTLCECLCRRSARMYNLRHTESLDSKAGRSHGCD